MKFGLISSNDAVRPSALIFYSDRLELDPNPSFVRSVSIRAPPVFSDLFLITNFYKKKDVDDLMMDFTVTLGKS